MDRSIIVRAALMLAACCWRPAVADIYSYTATDGAVSLSNVPTDRSYALLVPEGTASETVEPPAIEALNLPRPAAQYAPLVDRAAQKYGLDSALLHAVISVESRYDAKAVSKQGAVGLMQLMPDTAKRYKVDDALDPEQNLHGGARYLRDLLRLFDSDLSLVLAAYNAGENRVIRNGYRIPQLKETLDYVPRVLNLYRRYLLRQATAASRSGAAGIAAAAVGKGAGGR
ncbi:MAG: lytic transglycosylase domain-containing protein [Rhodocyclales bacterium]|nr:lytic transglycosylase domain-containing protein [Rhodocyclales bacterium]